MYEFSINGVLIPKKVNMNDMISKMLDYCYIPIFIENQGKDFEEIRQKVLDDDGIEAIGVMHFIKYETNFEA